MNASIDPVRLNATTLTLAQLAEAAWVFGLENDIKFGAAEEIIPPDDAPPHDDHDYIQYEGSDYDLRG